MYLFKSLLLIPLFLGGFTPLVQCHAGHDSLARDLKAVMRHHPRDINARTHVARANNLNKRALSSIAIAEGEGDALACTSAQVVAINQGITDARALATAASSVLGVSGSEDSDAYLQWFGGGNSNAVTRIAIKANNYESLLADLDGPILSIESDVGTNNLDATGLTFLCAPSTFSSCSGGVVAVAHETDTSMQGNVIALCPSYFTLPSQQSMLSEIASGRFTMPSAGFAMVHEVQHLSVIVSSARRCADQPDSAAGGGCYSVACCTGLAGNLKITNAQNMAFFAADVLANPSRGAPPDAQSCVIQKREISPGPAALLQKAEEHGQVYNRFRKQATTPSKAVSSSVPESKPPFASKPATTSSGPLSSSKPPSSSRPPTTSSRPLSSSKPPSSSRPPTTSSGPPSSSKPTTTSSTQPTGVPPGGGGGGGQNAATTPSTSKPTSTSSSSSLQSTSRCSTNSNKPFPTGTGPADQDGLNSAQLAELLRLGAAVTSTITSAAAKSSTTTLSAPPTTTTQSIQLMLN